MSTDDTTTPTRPDMNTLEEFARDDMAVCLNGTYVHQLVEWVKHLERTETIDVVFDGPPAPESGRFIEVEDARGRSVRLGEWVQRDDGYWVIRFTIASSEVGR